MPRTWTGCWPPSPTWAGRYDRFWRGADAGM
jgi:hypothetical protein